jgi:hypothetical protein
MRRRWRASRASLAPASPPSPIADAYDELKLNSPAPGLKQVRAPKPS